MSAHAAGACAAGPMPSWRRAHGPGALGACLALLLALAGCGGEGPDASGTAGRAQPLAAAAQADAAGTGGSSGHAAALGATLVQLRGVAAFGAPLVDATVRVIDGSGQLVGTTTTHATDGSYVLTVPVSATPLIIQAAGLDARGQPVVLHSVHNSLAATAVAHVTPFTDAVIALAIGAEPKAVFDLAPTLPAVLAPLARLTPASDFLKTLVKANLTDAKITDTKTLNFFSDVSFSANKTLQDLSLESLVIDYGVTSEGKPQLQLTNKLAVATPVEVTVDLIVAAAELFKTTGGKPANAITSTVKATTSPGATLMTNLAKLDDLAASFNKVIAENAGREPESVASTLSTSGLMKSYTQHDGKAALALATRLGQYAKQQMQLGRLQVTGCLDETAGKNGCVKLGVAARVLDAGGTQADSLADAVSWIAGTPARWLPVGNGQPAEMGVRSVAWLDLRYDGTPAEGDETVALTGVEVRAGSAISAATVQMPSGYSLPLSDCNRSLLCLNTGATPVQASGSVTDHAVFRYLNQWVGAADVTAGAAYAFTFDSGGTSSTRNLLLRGSFPWRPQLSRFPVLDYVSPQSPLPFKVPPGLVWVSWGQWARANIDMRLVSMRVVMIDEAGASTRLEWSPTTWSRSLMLIDLPELDPAVYAGALELWLVAVDHRGRWYQTRYRLML